MREAALIVWYLMLPDKSDCLRIGKMAQVKLLTERQGLSDCLIHWSREDRGDMEVLCRIGDKVARMQFYAPESRCREEMLPQNLITKGEK